MTAAPKSLEGSLAIQLSWSNDSSNHPPTSCLNPSGGGTWTGTHHLEVHMTKGVVDDPCALTATAPTSPSSGTLVANLAGGSTGTNVYVHRASKDFAFALFACKDASCSSWYADGTRLDESVTAGSNDDGECTEPEKWLLGGIEDTSDTDRAIPDPANASGALFYPAGFYDGSTNLEGRLGIWWSEPETSSSTFDVIYHKRAGAPGIQPFNTYTSWENEVEVARETGGSGDWSNLSHPWVAATHTGSTDGITMWVRQQVPSPSTFGQVLWFPSLDEEGADFGLECTDTAGCTVDGDTCTYGELCDYATVGGEVAVCAADTDACTHFDHIKHGRVIWNYVAEGPIDPTTDSPGLMASGRVVSHTPPQSTDCPAVGLSEDDLYFAQWDGTEWDVEDDSGSPVCPVAHVEDAHDPGVIPLPNGEFKMYLQQDAAGTNATEWVTYWNPTTGAWEDTSEILFSFDDGYFTEVNPICVENMDALVYASSTGISELMFVKLYESTACFSESGIAYASKRN